MSGRSVVVLGTGRVAPAIAAAFAQDWSVTIVGRSKGRAESCANTASSLGKKAVSASSITRRAFSEASLVIEAVAESLDAKKSVFETIDPWIPTGVSVVSNTSSLPLEELARSLRDTSRFAGLHFLHPAHLTAVVELVPLSTTSTQTVDDLVSIVRGLKKRAILVRRPVPGYVWNRLQMAVIREALALVADGIVDAASVDAAVAEGLAPRWLSAGPLATVDLGGVGTFHEIARQLFPHLATDSVPNERFEHALGAGGFFDWSPEELEELADVRRSALKVGREVAERRPQPAPIE